MVKVDENVIRKTKDSSFNKQNLYFLMRIIFYLFEWFYVF